MPLRLRVTLGVLGALVYAGAGAVIGAQNARWFGLEREANPVLPVLGVGAALVVAAFAPSHFRKQVHETGALGIASEALLLVGSLLYIVSAIIEFAIIGTLTFGLGLVCLAIVVIRRRLVAAGHRVLITLSAIGSLMWNTETVSAFLLSGVGLIWVVLTTQLLDGERRAARTPSSSAHG